MSGTDVTFRSAVPQEAEVDVVDPKVKVDHSSGHKTDIETPFTEYRNENKLPFTADYMDVKLTWEEADMVEDVTAIEDYLSSLVAVGDLSNSTKAAREKLKSVEKMAGIDKLESQAQRLIKLAEFVKYLGKIETRKHGIIL
jgi:hypothetical protein